MIKKITYIVCFLILTSCASVKEKIPERKACTGENDTLADIFCKK